MKASRGENEQHATSDGPGAPSDDQSGQVALGCKEGARPPLKGAGESSAHDL